MTTLAAQQVRGGGESAPRVMRAAVVAAPRRVEIEERPLVDPGPGQVRVRLEGCGVCGSNIPAWEGREWFTYPLEAGLPGHEGWGWIDALGPGVDGVEVGQRVAVLSYHAFAEHDTADAGAVVPLPEAVGDGPFPGEALGCAMNVLARSGIARGHTVAVVGVGFLGALLVQLAAAAGARVIAISRRLGALETARAMGAARTVVIDHRGRALEDAGALTGGKLCDVVIEAAGFQEPLDIAAALVKERGRLVVAGFHQDRQRRVDMQSWNWRGIDVINAHERDWRVSVDGMRAAVEAVVAGRLRPRELYTHVYPLERLGEALESARVRPDGFMKSIVTMGGASGSGR